jgi:hypothetical protein
MTLDTSLVSPASSVIGGQRCGDQVSGLPTMRTTAPRGFVASGSGRSITEIRPACFWLARFADRAKARLRLPASDLEPQPSGSQPDHESQWRSTWLLPP